MTPGAGRIAAPVASLRQRALGWWRSRLKRERQALALLAAVLGFLLVWTVFVQPAWRSAAEAPARIDQLDAQLQEMQRTAAESRTLGATAPVAAAQAAQALKAATDRLGDRGKLIQRGDRATLNFTNLGAEALRAWLAEVRSGARARPVEAQMQRGPAGYNGSIVVSVGGPP